MMIHNLEKGIAYLTAQQHSLVRITYFPKYTQILVLLNSCYMIDVKNYLWLLFTVVLPRRGNWNSAFEVTRDDTDKIIRYYIL